VSRELVKSVVIVMNLQEVLKPGDDRLFSQFDCPQLRGVCLALGYNPQKVSTNDNILALGSIIPGNGESALTPKKVNISQEITL
jgi:hypothetical protein